MMGKVIQLRPGEHRQTTTRTASPRLSNDEFNGLVDRFCAVCTEQAESLESNHPGAIQATPSAILIAGLNMLREQRGDVRTASMLRDLLEIVEPESPAA